MTGFIKKFKFWKESPTPNADIMTSFLNPWDFISSRTFATESAIKRGGAIGLAKGLSLSRGAFRVTMTA